MTSSQQINNTLPWKRNSLHDRECNAFAFWSHSLQRQGFQPCSYVEGYLTPIFPEELSPLPRPESDDKQQRRDAYKRRKASEKKTKEKNKTLRQSLSSPPPYAKAPPMPPKKKKKKNKKKGDGVTKRPEVGEFPTLPAENQAIIDDSDESYEFVAGQSQSEVEPPSGDDISHLSDSPFDSQLSRLVSRSSEMTPITDAGHLTDQEESQIAGVISRLNERYGTEAVGKIGKYVEQILFLCIGLRYDASIDAIILRCATFLSAISDRGVAMYLKDAMENYCRRTAAAVPESIDQLSGAERYSLEVRVSEGSLPVPEAGEAAALWNALKQGIFTNQLAYVLGTVFAFTSAKITNVEFSHPMVEELVKHSQKDTVNCMDIVDKSIQLYNWFSTVGLECIRRRSLEPLTINSGAIATCSERFYHWNSRFPEITRGREVVPDEKTVALIEMEKVEKTLMDIIKYKRDGALSLQSSTLLRDVRTLHQSIRDYVRKSDVGLTAFGVYIHGKPEVGKSTFTPTIIRQLCAARKTTYDVSRTAYLNVKDSFQDGIDSTTQAIVINECIPVKSQFDSDVAHIYGLTLALCDSSPFHPNRSNLEAKSKETANHICTISSGNGEEPFAFCANDPNAWNRRYLNVEMITRPEFAGPRGQLDKSKVDGSEEYWNFKVKTIYYTTSPDTSKVERKIQWYATDDGVSSELLTTPQFLQLLRKLALKHYEAEDRRLKAHHENLKVEDCIVCSNLAKNCTCEIKPKDRVEVKSHVPFCQFGGVLEGKRQRCKPSEKDKAVCAVCGTRIIYLAEPEAGETFDQSIRRVLIKEFFAWINPFAGLQTLYNIDRAVWASSEQELVREVRGVSDTIASHLFALAPESWETRSDGSQSFFGRMKESYIRLIAANHQVLMPLSVIIRRSMTFGLLTGLAAIGLTPWRNLKFRYWGRINEEYQLLPEVRSWDWEKGYPRRKICPEVKAINSYLDWKDASVPWWTLPIAIGIAGSVSFGFFQVIRQSLGIKKRVSEISDRIRKSRTLNAAIYKDVKSHPAEYNSIIPTAVGCLGLIATGLAIWNNQYRRAEQLDGEQRTRTWNDYFSAFRNQPSPPDPKVATIPADHCVNRAKNNILLFEFPRPENSDRVVRTNMFCLESKIGVLPAHVFNNLSGGKYEALDYTAYHKGDYSWRGRIHYDACVPIEGKDAILIPLPKGPDLKDLRDHLPKAGDWKGVFKSVLVALNPDGRAPLTEILSSEYLENIEHTQGKCGRGVTYHSAYTTTGFCGSPIIAERQGGTILGFHVCGSSNLFGGKRTGYAQEITREAYEKSRATLEGMVGAAIGPESRVIEKERLGAKFFSGSGPHPRASFFDDPSLPKGTGLVIHGHNTSLARYKSKVVRSLLSKSMEVHTGIPCLWKAPDMSQPWKHHNKALMSIVEGAFDVPQKALEWAYQDYLEPILPAVIEWKVKAPDLCRVLTLDEAINGHPGGKFMNPLDMTTSMGPPIMGPKKKHFFVEMEPYDDGRNRYGWLPEMHEEYFRILSLLDSNQRYGVWVTTCLKDEAVALEKDKVRIFYILQAIFSVLVRQYYLPVIEFICAHPLLTESAVGINCASSEWENLMSHVEELTDGYATDMDYKNYDLKRPVNVMIATNQIYVEIAKTMGYSDEALARMRAIGHELRNPMINWNGTVVSVFLWTSGNSLTVFGNGTDNSLLNRCSFYQNGVAKLGLEEFEKLGPYRDNERLTTYGDDNVGGHRPEVRDICNFFAKREFFESLGMVVTPADKGSEPQAVIPFSEIDFLKRRSVFHPEFGIRVGALEPKSIYKMGHMTRTGSEPLEDLAAMSYGNMLLEASLHGREFYETLRSQLRLVAADTSIGSPELDLTYDHRVDAWKAKYA